MSSDVLNGQFRLLRLGRGLLLAKFSNPRQPPFDLGELFRRLYAAEAVSELPM